MISRDPHESDEARDETAAWVAGSTEPGRRYRVIRDHARGGLGIVYVARDEELHRDVALKEIQAGMADHAEFRARFLLEAEVTGRLEHPGIVPVYGLGKHDDGRPYYIMRFIRGETLKDAIGRLHAATGGPAADYHPAVGRLVAACYAVAYAHSRKILHRDLKPANIMLGEYGETLVVDWGLAKSVDIADLPTPSDEGTIHPESESDVTPTLAGNEMGTRGYMSPEQAAGRVADLGPASDLYSLGATLYCLLTGRRPFADLGRAVYLRAVESGDFPSPREVLATIPRPLEAICLKAMALRPVDRYASARAMAEDLERWLVDRPTLAYPEPWPARLARWSRRHRTALAAAAMLLACASAGLVAYAAQARREAARVSAAWRASERDKVLALGVIDRMLEVVTSPELVYLPNSEGLRSVKHESILGLYRELRARHPADPRIRFALAHALRLAANLRRVEGDHGRSGEFYEEALGLLAPADARVGVDDEAQTETVLTLIDSGENLRMSGKPRLAEAETLKAQAARKRPGRPDDGGPVEARIEAMIRLNLGWARIETGRPAEARADLGRAVAILAKLADDPRAVSSDRLLMASAQSALGVALRDLGQRGPASERAADAIRRARELVAAHRNPDSLSSLAAALSERGRLQAESGESALTTFHEALTIATNLSNQHPSLDFLRRDAGIAYDGRGAAFLADKRLADARRDCDRARVLFDGLIRTAPGSYDYWTQLGRATANLGRVSIAEGKPDARDFFGQAIEHHRKALALNGESPDDHKFMAACRAELERIESGPASR